MDRPSRDVAYPQKATTSPQTQLDIAAALPPHSREAGVIDAFSYTHAVYVDTGTRRTHGYSLLPLRWMFVCSPLGHTRLLGLSRHEIELRRGRHGRWEQVRSSDEEEYASGHLV